MAGVVGIVASMPCCGMGSLRLSRRGYGRRVLEALFWGLGRSGVGARDQGGSGESWFAPEAKGSGEPWLVPEAKGSGKPWLVPEAKGSGEPVLAPEPW